MNMAKRVLKKEEVIEKVELQNVEAGEENDKEGTVSDKMESIAEGANTDVIPENADTEIRQASDDNLDAESEEKEPCNFQNDIQADDMAVEGKKEEEGTIFRSTSEELRSIIRTIVEDGEVYSKKELVRILTERASSSFTEACLINVLRNMVGDGYLMQVERGSYMKGNGSFKSRLHKYLMVTRTGFRKACILTASEMEEADFEIVKQVKTMEGNIDLLIETLERLGA